jgi:hypothetical protein
MIKIYIRKKFKDDQIKAPEFLKKEKVLLDLIEMYDGLYQDELERLSQEKSVNGAENTI